MYLLHLAERIEVREHRIAIVPRTPPVEAPTAPPLSP